MGGKFIVFEGIDGSGKSTQIALLKERLLKEGRRVETSAEPTEGAIGKLLRRILSGEIPMNGEAIASLFASDRLDHLLNPKTGLIKKLDGCTTVIEDRYYFSSYAYHAYDMPMALVRQMNAACAARLKADLTIFIDVDPDICLERIKKNRTQIEIFEKKDRLEKTRSYYFQAFRDAKGENICIIDGNRPPAEIHEEVWNLVEML